MFELLLTLASTTLVMLFPRRFIQLLNDDPGLSEVGVPMLRIYVGGMFILGANSTLQQIYYSLGSGGRSFFFAFYRKVILLIPLIYILPALLPWGVFAVVLAEPISDTITTCTNAVCFRLFLKKLLADVHEKTH